MPIRLGHQEAKSLAGAPSPSPSSQQTAPLISTPLGVGMTESDLLAAIVQTFSRHSRPTVFTNAHHCCECAEHNQTLSAYTPESLTSDAIGNPGWDPVCFATEAAYLYFFPGLARLALAGRGESFYLDQFVSQLSNRTHLFDASERQLAHALLWHLIDTFDGDPYCDDFTLWRLDDCLRKLEEVG